MEFALDNFNFTVSVFSGKLDTSFDFSSSMVVPRFDINIDPVKISDLLRLIPERSEEPSCRERVCQYV